MNTRVVTVWFSKDRKLIFGPSCATCHMKPCTDGLVTTHVNVHELCSECLVSCFFIIKINLYWYIVFELISCSFVLYNIALIKQLLVQDAILYFLQRSTWANIRLKMQDIQIQGPFRSVNQTQQSDHSERVIR